MNGKNGVTKQFEPHIINLTLISRSQRENQTPNSFEKLQNVNK